MTEPDDPRPPRRGRLAKEKRVPISLRVTPRMHGRMTQAANINGRSLTQQSEYLLELGLLIEEGPSRVIEELYRAPAPPSKELSEQLARLQIQFAGLQGAIENGLDRNTTAVTRLWSQLSRLVPQFEAKLAADATELTAAIGHLQTLTAHLLAALQKLEAIDRSRRAEATDAPPRPRALPKAG